MHFKKSSDNTHAMIPADNKRVLDKPAWSHLTTMHAHFPTALASTCCASCARAARSTPSRKPISSICDFREVFNATAPDFTPYYAALHGCEPHAVLPTDRVLQRGLGAGVEQ